MPLAPLPDEDVTHVVRTRRWCTPVVAELTLDPLDGPIDFRAGQYVLLQDEQGVVPPRSYSLANAPRPDGSLTIWVTAVPGGPTSTWLSRGVQVGDTILVSGPYGSFVADPQHTGPTLYLAGGSGLAPMRALIEEAFGVDAAHSPHPRAEHLLLFSARGPDHLIDHEWFLELSSRHPEFSYLRTFTRVPSAAQESPQAPPLGHIPDVLAEILPDLAEHAVYIAGSPGLVAACTRAAKALRARPGALHTEEFYAEPAPWHGALPAITQPAQPRLASPPPGVNHEQ